MAVTNMKKMMARFSMKSVFLVLLLLFFVYLLSTYFIATRLPLSGTMRGWYEGMTTEKDAKTATEPDATKTATEKDAKVATEKDAKVATEKDAKVTEKDAKVAT